MGRKIKDLVGKVFGDLVVIKYFGPLKPDNKKDKKQAWVCKCKCGKESVVRASCLNCENYVSSCFECARKENGLKYSNLIGQRFGRILVISKADRPNVKNGDQYWNVVCDCGKEKIVSTSPLKRGTTVSCGCYNKENASKIHTTHGLSKDYKKYNKFRLSKPSEKIKHAIGNAVRSFFKEMNAQKKGSVWKYLPYTPEDFKKHIENLWEPWMNWDNYGGRSNEEKKTWWIDHIKPQNMFKFESMEDQQFLECWALSNLRPMEKKANMSKGSKYKD